MKDNTTYCYIFKIADILITLKTEKLIHVSDRFHPFIMSGISSGDYEVVFHEVDKLPDLPDEWLQTGGAFDVGKFPSGKYFRRFRDMMHGEIYAAAFYDWDRKKVEIEYLSSGQENLNQSDNCFFHIAWETIMQLERCMILHACCIDTYYGGILFSGKSGIGKSTQGNLWCQYENAVLVNGDRPIVKKDGSVWYAYGSPYAGSSRCHRDVRTPVKAIIMLKQAKQCSIRKLDAGEAFRNVYTGMTLSPWNPDCVRNSCDLAMSLVSEIPVYEMECTPDKQAVELLKRTLQMEVDR